MSAAPTTEAQVVLVVAVAENGVIGAKGGLPWRLRSDLRRFRAMTMGKPVVMGRRTFESIGRPLDGRDNIVVTRQGNEAAEGLIIAGSIAAALDLGRQRAAARGANEICVIGGGQIFAETLPAAMRIYFTRVHAAPDGDVFFPPLAPEEWVEVSREELPFSDGDTAAATFIVYGRRRE